MRDIERLEGHVIIAGWGRMGHAIAHSVGRSGLDIVIIDREPADDACVMQDLARPKGISLDVHPVGRIRRESAARVDLPIDAFDELVVRGNRVQASRR